MDARTKSVFGTYRNEDEAAAGVDALRRAGFSNYEVTMIREDGAEPDSGITEGAALGALAGGVLGLFVGLVAMAIPGPIAFFLAGPVIDTLIGALLGALVGTIYGYKPVPAEGRVLIAVHVESDEDRDRAMEKLELTGATEITASQTYQTA